MEPNIETGIFEDIVDYVNQQSRLRSRLKQNKNLNINLNDILNYLDSKGYKRIILIDYSCNVVKIFYPI